MALLNLQSARIIEAREANKVMMTQEILDQNEPEALIKLSMLENEIDKATYKASIDTYIHLTDSEKT